MKNIIAILIILIPFFGVSQTLQVGNIKVNSDTLFGSIDTSLIPEIAVLRGDTLFNHEGDTSIISQAYWAEQYGHIYPLKDTVTVGNIHAPSSIFEVKDLIKFKNFSTTIGQEANQNKTGAYNTSVGYRANQLLTTGNYNTSLGNGAGSNVTTGLFNTFVGYYAGRNVTTYGNNVIVGNNAGQGGNIQQTVAIGNSACQYGDNTTNHIAGVWIGFNAGRAATSNYSSTGVGYAVADSALDIRYYTGFGNVAARNALYLDRSVSSGYAAHGNKDTVMYSIGLGHEADMGLIADGGKSLNNIVIGRYANKASINTSYNTIIGNDALQGDTSDNTGNTLLGFASMRVRGGNFNTFLGTQTGAALHHYTAHQDSAILIGSYAGSAMADTLNNQFIIANDSLDSHKLMYGIVDGENQLTINAASFNIENNGTSLLNYNGLRNTSVGSSAMTSAHPSSGECTALGFSALGNQTTGYYNVALGAYASANNTNGHDNLAIGRMALRLNGSGFGNIAIGTQSGYNNGGNYNVFIGYQSGYAVNVSNKLYIENSNSTTPLIYGEFDNDMLRVNGSLETTASITRDVNSYTAAHTADNTDNIMLFTLASANYTLTLPNATAEIGKIYTIKVIANATNTYELTVATAGGNIDGAATYLLDTEYDAINVVSDGTDWYIY